MITVVGYTEAFLPISVVKAIRWGTGLGLARSKALMEAVAGGQSISLEPLGDIEESAFRRRLEKAGLVCAGDPVEDGGEREFVYLFSYEDPDGIDSDEVTGPEPLLEGFFRIRAGSAEEALAWGRTLSDWYVGKLFEDDRPGRWSKAGLASWIEEEPDALLRDGMRELEAVGTGEYPDLAKVHRLYEADWGI